MLALRRERAAQWKSPALLLAVLLLVATILLWLADRPGRYESLAGNLAGTLIFITAASFFIAVISIRSFLRTGAWPALWLGAGALAFGLSTPLSNLFLALYDTNAGVTMHNLGALLAGFLHGAGAFFAINRILPQEAGRPRRSVVIQMYGSTGLLLGLIAAAAATGTLPPFFVQGVGGTPVRQLIVGSAATLFFLAGVLFLRHYAATRTLMVYWYALGLMLISLGLAGILLISATGTALNWLGRAAQWLGGLYLLVAAWVTWREARARNVPAGEVLASYFLRRESDLRRLFDSIQDAMVVTDEAFNITFWNRGAEAIYGWTADEVLGRSAADVLGTMWVGEGSRERATGIVHAGGFTVDEVTQLRRDGSRIVVYSSISGVKDETGRVLGAVAVNRDITERRAAEEEIRRLNAGLAERAAQLEASNRELEAFAYSVSHDLRAPLRAVAGYAEALDEDYGAGLDATGRAYLARLRTNAGRMGELIDDLLALARVGRQELERVHVDVGAVARAAWDELAAERAARRVTFRVAAMPPASADPTLVKQAWMNLLSNAIKFTRERDPALIEVGCADEAEPAAVYFVRDNGIGFDMAHADRLFGLFHRLHRQEEYEGTGVGLAITRRVVERHGGRAWAVAEPGRGATFYFTLGEDSRE